VLLRWPLAALELVLLKKDQPTELAGLDVAGLGLVGLVGLILVVTIGAPVFEELFFRGLMLPTLSRSWPVWAAVAVSSAIFGVLHVGQPVPAIAYITLTGAVLAVVRIRTHSLVPCVVAHAVFNTTSVLMLLTLR
jgi:membrane protease YdiL (CAAX protease family)